MKNTELAVEMSSMLTHADKYEVKDGEMNSVIALGGIFIYLSAKE